MKIISLQSIIPVKPEYNFFQSGGYFSFITLVYCTFRSDPPRVN